MAAESRRPLFTFLVCKIEKMLKILIAIALSPVFWVTTLHAQMSAGGFTPPDFNAVEAAGLINYEWDEVTKKLKIKDEENRNEVAEALKVYNSKIDELAFEHASTFRELEEDFDSNLEIAMQRRDRSQMNGVRSRIQEVILPIRKQVAAEEEVLNEAMALILTEKQNEKWLKYQNRKKGQP